MTVPELKKEFVGLLALVLSRYATSGPVVDETELDSWIKTIVKKYTGDSETLMFDPQSITHHCKT